MSAMVRGCVLVVVLRVGVSNVSAAGVVSDGSLGAFHPTANQTISLDSVAPDGVLNYTTVHIPAGVTVRFSPNAANTTVFLAATGDVLIEGTVDVSAGGFSRAPGPGGYYGGLASLNGQGQDGFGLAPGKGGPLPAGQGNGGGGGGMGSPGLIATSRSGSNPGAPGGVTSIPPMVPGVGGGGGSGGGGGGGRLFFGVDISGGVGGGGGGALQISTPGELAISGALIANGGHGGWAFANVFAHGGPGGGGAGGNIVCYAGTITFLEGATFAARGGAGGGLSTEPVPNAPYFYSSGAHGGDGYVVFGIGTLNGPPPEDLPDVVSIVGVYPVADRDGDGHVDAADVTLVLACLLGPELGVHPDCADGDLDLDGDGDLRDLSMLQQCYSGEAAAFVLCGQE